MTDIDPIPFLHKGRRALRPEAGRKMYIPGDSSRKLVAGLATVTKIFQLGGRWFLQTEEHPDVTYRWGYLQPEQFRLHAQYKGQAARLLTQEEVDELAKERLAALARAEEEERQRWAPKRFAVANRGLLEVPLLSDRPRDRNWAATIDIDPLAPGGLSRAWFARGRGPCPYILPDTLRVGVALEFAADAVAYSGTVRRVRWWGVVTALSDTFVEITPHADAATAVMASKKAQSAA